MSYARSETSPTAIIGHWRQHNDSQFHPARPDDAVLQVSLVYNIRRLTEFEKGTVAYDGDGDLPWYGIFVWESSTEVILAVCDDLSALIHVTQNADTDLYFSQ